MTQKRRTTSLLTLDLPDREGVDELCENRGYFGPDGPEITEKELVGRVAERYRHGHELHVHVQLRTTLADEHVRYVCALHQRLPEEVVETLDNAVLGDELWRRFLSGDQNRVEGLVFVPVVQFSEDGERMASRILSVVRLMALDRQPLLVRDAISTGRILTPRGPRRSLGTLSKALDASPIHEGAVRLGDREGDRSRLLPAGGTAAIDQRPEQVVKNAAEVVQGIAEDQPEVSRWLLYDSDVNLELSSPSGTPGSMASSRPALGSTQ
jgi:hypothetical protein